MLNATTITWNESTRNEFHPGDIITALNQKWCFSPRGRSGTVELACHLLTEREDSERFLYDGRVPGYYIEVIPRILQCQTYLTQKFPKLAEYSNKYSDEELQKKFSTKKGEENCIREVEQLFGKTVIVLPIAKNREEEPRNRGQWKSKL